MSARTVIFSRLRSALQPSVPEPETEYVFINEPELGSIFDDLQGLRKTSTKILSDFREQKLKGSGPVFQDLFYNVFLDCWRTLSTLNESEKVFSLPPLYISESMSSHLRSASDSLFLLEVGQRRAGDNPIFCGCEVR